MASTTRSSALQDFVESELGWDPQVTSARIGVTTHDGVVTLSGFVPSFAERFAAERAALRVRGTRAVANELVVKLLMDRIDPDIAKDAADALRLNASVPATVKLTVSSGFITLEGSCEWWFQRKAAEDAVATCAGDSRASTTPSSSPLASRPPPSGPTSKTHCAAAPRWTPNKSRSGPSATKSSWAGPSALMQSGRKPRARHGRRPASPL